MSSIQRAETREHVLELQRAIEEAHSQRGKELRAASRVRWNGVVVWGPNGDEGELKDCEF